MAITSVLDFSWKIGPGMSAFNQCVKPGLAALPTQNRENLPAAHGKCPGCRHPHSRATAMFMIENDLAKVVI
jgi:hypothetical protein